jgi:hypothetical protein
MYFMLIVKNLFSFYVEFEILLYFLLFCRLLNENKDSTWEITLGMRWVRFTRRNQAKTFTYKNYGPQLSIADRKCSLVRSEKNEKNYGPQKLGWKREFTVLKRFSQEKERFLTSIHPRHLWTVWRGDLKQERRGVTSLEGEFEEELKNRVRNRRSS